MSTPAGSTAQSETSAPAGQRGIVLCAGGQRYFTSAYVLVSLLRDSLGCVLPIEVWHRGPQELDDGMADLLAALGATTRPLAADTVLAATTVDSLRIAALRASDFEEALYLDADMVPLQDPAVAFEWDAYRETGLFCFPDRGTIPLQDPGWLAAGLECRNVPLHDPGFILIDKARHGDLLHAAGRLADKPPDGPRQPIRRASALDFAMLSAGVTPARPATGPFDAEGELLHGDLAGIPFLQHRRTAKWALEGHNPPTPDPALTSAAESALAALRDRWSGRIFHPPARSPAAQAVESALAAIRTFQYKAGEGGARGLTLHPGGRVGAGRDDYEQHWAVVDGENGLELVFYSHVSAMVRLTSASDGSWTGVCAGPYGFAATLTAEETPTPAGKT